MTKIPITYIKQQHRIPVFYRGFYTMPQTIEQVFSNALTVKQDIDKLIIVKGDK